MENAGSNCVEITFCVLHISFMSSQPNTWMFYSGGPYFEFKKWYKVIKHSLDVEQKKLDEERAK